MPLTHIEKPLSRSYCVDVAPDLVALETNLAPRQCSSRETLATDARQRRDHPQPPPHPPMHGVGLGTQDAVGLVLGVFALACFCGAAVYLWRRHQRRTDYPSRAFERRNPGPIRRVIRRERVTDPPYELRPLRAAVLPSAGRAVPLEHHTGPYIFEQLMCYQADPFSDPESQRSGTRDCESWLDYPSEERPPRRPAPPCVPSWRSHRTPRI